MRIFVYGSLRHKQGNSHWMTNAQLLGDFSIDNYQLYSLGHYPGAVPGNGTVHGEVYRIDNATLAELDALRTRGGEYARQLIQTGIIPAIFNCLFSGKGGSPMEAEFEREVLDRLIKIEEKLDGYNNAKVKTYENEKAILRIQIGRAHV